MLHISYHFIIPAIIAAIFFRADWKHVYLLLIATMLVDVDHLLANPIYDPTRCSIGFHPLHSFIAIIMYSILCFLPKPRYLRIIAIGLMIHMFLDSLDCQMTNSTWF
jgi:hypothetical protein